MSTQATSMFSNSVKSHQKVFPRWENFGRHIISLGPEYKVKIPSRSEATALGTLFFDQKRKHALTQTQITQLLDTIDTQTKALLKAENEPVTLLLTRSRYPQ